MSDLATIQRPASALAVHAMTPDQIALLKRTVAAGTTDDEFALFMHMAQRAGLDPFQRQIYAVKRWSKRDEKEVMAIQTGIDGFRLMAQRTGEYLGQTPPEWCGADGVWKTVWLSSDHPHAARVGVFKRGNPNPTYRVALWSEFAQRGKRRDGGTYLMGLWATMPANQLLKCAEAQALRAAFPNDLGGIYTTEEMGQADNPPPVTIATTAPALPPAEDEPAREPVTIHWADAAVEGTSERSVGTVTRVEPERDSRGLLLRVTIVREDGDARVYLSRSPELEPIARAACETKAIVEFRFQVAASATAEYRRLVSIVEPQIGGADAP